MFAQFADDLRMWELCIHLPFILYEDLHDAENWVNWVAKEPIWFETQNSIWGNQSLSLEGVDLYCFALPPKLEAEIACQAHVDGISRRRHISVCNC
jgi:hypothetical protein